MTDTALLIVDVQVDYLARPGMIPDSNHLISGVQRLLSGFREASAPVAHARTSVRADGSDAMRHWHDLPQLPCVAGSPGAAAPAELVERPGEYVAHKQHYDAFADAGLDAWLRQQRVDIVVIAGLYTHACVRQTALRAYELGYSVIIAADAVASEDPAHAASTLTWISGRAASVMSTDEILTSLSTPSKSTASLGDQALTQRARDAQRSWSREPLADRAAAVERWAHVLQSHADEAVQLLIDEVGKPRAAATDEVERAIAHLLTATSLAQLGLGADQKVADGVTVRRVPVGVVAALKPWNNPIALPCGTIGPALVLGNTVVFKPAPEAVRCGRFLLRTIAEAGLPADVLVLAEGSSDIGSALVADPQIDAVAVTGSVATGRMIAAACARLGKPLQAELGGNNAAIVLADADLALDIPALVRGAFSFSGQRCTAVRRLVVAEQVLDEVARLAVECAEALPAGDPASQDTVIGPLISHAARDRVHAAVVRAIDSGATLLTGGHALNGDLPMYAPTILLSTEPRSEIVQNETFGPVLVIQPASDLAEAIALANGVEQGLLMAVCTDDALMLAKVAATAEVGILQLGSTPPSIHAEAPFGGWKASGFGPPEHGAWDADFLTRVQAVYG